MLNGWTRQKKKFCKKFQNVTKKEGEVKKGHRVKKKKKKKRYTSRTCIELRAYLEKVSLRIREEVWNRGRPWRQWARRERSSWKNSRVSVSGSRCWRWYPRRVQGSTGSIAMSVYQALLVSPSSSYLSPLINLQGKQLGSIALRKI